MRRLRRVLWRQGMDANTEGREVAHGRDRRRSKIRRLNESWLLPGTNVVVVEATSVHEHEMGRLST